MTSLHRLALLAYPREFREEFGGELERIFERRLEAERSRSDLRRLGLAFYLVGDAVVSGFAERIRRRKALRQTHRAADVIAPGSRTMTAESVVRDIAYSCRQLLRQPAFTLLTIAFLALGIGANASIFAVVNAVLLRPLPYADPESLVTIWSNNAKNNEPDNPVSPANFEAFRRAPSLAGAEAFYSFLTPVQIRLGGEPEPAVVSQVTPGMLTLLGRAPLLGRKFDDEGTPDGAVLSYQFWKRRLGGDPNVIGTPIFLSGAGESVAIPVIGVMPEDFTFPYGSMLWRSGFTRSTTADMWWRMSRERDPRLVDASGQPNRTIHYFGVVGRLRTGVSFASARHDLEAIASGRAAEFPDTNLGWGVTVRPLHEQAVGAMRPALLILLAGVAAVLLITCMNVANMLLARAAGRGRDLAIRSALGASRGRLVQQMLIESLILSLAGGLAGVGAMVLGLQALVAAAPGNLPRIGEVSPSWPVVGFGIALAVAVGLAVGIIPALTAARSRAHDSLRDGTRTTASRSARRIRAALIVAEVSLAMVLAVGSGLLLRSFVAVLNVHPGFSPDHLLTMQVAVPPRYTETAATLAFYDELETRLRALPGVTAVGGTTRLPLGSTNVTTYLEIDGRGLAPSERPEVEMRRALFDYFSAMQIPVLRGRTFTIDDHPGAPPAAVVNDVLAARLFPGEDPIGKRVRFAQSSDGAWMTIVGVVGGIRHANLEEPPRPEIYIWYRQGPPVGPFVVLRTSGDPAALSEAVRGAVRSLGADPPRDIRTMEAIRSGALAQRRFVLLLVGIFGALALGLSALGVFGVVTLISAERTAEVGIRLALGASPAQVLAMVVGHSLRLAGLGIALGTVAALLLSPLVKAQLFGIVSVDPVTYAAVALVLVLISLGAAYIPARRAMKIDPATALRV